MFADDTTLLFEHADLRIFSMVNDELHKIYEWFKDTYKEKAP